MADPTDGGIINLIELALQAREEIEAVLSNPKVKPALKKRFEAVLRSLDSIIARAENPDDATAPEMLAEGVNTLFDRTSALAAEAGFDLDDFGAINEDALAILTGQPAEPPIGDASEIIIGRTEPGELRNLQIRIAAEVMLAGGGQRDYQEKLLAEIEAKGIALPEPFSDRPTGYAEMASRTLFAEIQRARTEQRGRRAGIETGQVTAHSALDACRFSEGVVFTWPWAPRRKGMPTQDEVKSTNPHLGHPNCAHGFVNYIADLVDDIDAAEAQQAAQQWQNFAALSPEDRKAAVNAANAEAREAAGDSWDSVATESGV